MIALYTFSLNLAFNKQISLVFLQLSCISGSDSSPCAASRYLHLRSSKKNHLTRSRKTWNPVETPSIMVSFKEDSGP